jgi:PD-(D/E)XK nuclease superfamily
MSSHYYDKRGNLVPPWTPDAYPSPSTILDRLRSMEYEALVERVGQEEADNLMDAAKARGTRVHKACELWANEGDITEAAKRANLLVEEMPYLNGFVNWWKTYLPLDYPLDTELFVYSDKYKFAGTADLVVWFEDQPWLIDIKTGQDNVRHGLQLKFYQQAYYEMTGIKCRMGVLALDAKRKAGYRNSKSPYGLKEFKEPLWAIVAHLRMFNWWRKKRPASRPQIKDEPVWR